MLKIILPTRSIYISFAHLMQPPINARWLRVTGNKDLKLPTTTCKLFEEHQDYLKTIGIGVGQCVPLDRFEKEKGRKSALAKALALTTLTRYERGEVWKGYFNRGMSSKEVEDVNSE
jgi:hypothetical protein